jgi:hypothetical protein
MEDTSKFEDIFKNEVAKTRGILNLLKSVKLIPGFDKQSKVYKITLKRFHDGCIRLATFAESYAIFCGDKKRDELCSKVNCKWDSTNKRVVLL